MFNGLFLRNLSRVELVHLICRTTPKIKNLQLHNLLLSGWTNLWFINILPENKTVDICIDNSDFVSQLLIVYDKIYLFKNGFL